MVARGPAVRGLISVSLSLKKKKYWKKRRKKYWNLDSFTIELIRKCNIAVDIIWGIGSHQPSCLWPSDLLIILIPIFMKTVRISKGIVDGWYMVTSLNSPYWQLVSTFPWFNEIAPYLLHSRFMLMLKDYSLMYEGDLLLFPWSKLSFQHVRQMSN